MTRSGRIGPFALALLAVAVAAAMFAAPAAAVDVGNMLLRSFGAFDQQPLTMAEARSLGYANRTSCVPGYGIQMTMNGTAPGRSTPSVLYYTAAGQLAGFGAYAWGEPPETQEPRFWRGTGERGVYEIVLHTRDERLICSGQEAPETVGDRLVVGGEALPLTMGAAHDANWMYGNCIPGMGIHHSYDLAHPSVTNMTWKAENLHPIMPMYNSVTQRISAILIDIWNVQATLPFGRYEGPFPNALFCKNWCDDSGCHFSDTSVFSTMHWLFTDPRKNLCLKAECKLVL